MKYAVGGFSDKGKYREINQDRFFCHATEVSSKPFIIAAVCDGVGGSEHGEKAAEIVIEQLETWFEGVLKWIDSNLFFADNLFSALLDCVDACNEAVMRFIDEYHINTATTMSVLMVVDEEYLVAHVGDSRIYSIKGNVNVLTEDQITIVSGEEGTKQYLKNYIGKSYDLEIYTKRGRISPKDVFIVSSDGFYHKFEENDSKKIYKEIEKSKNISELAGKWVTIMEERGERDNVSLVIVRI